MEHTVTDLEGTLKIILQSDELEIDGLPVSENEKAELEDFFNLAINSIKRRRKKNKMKTVAIYSRKSKFTGKGESIENQVQMCTEYIKQRLNKDTEILIYEDEGFSGGTTNRPKFKEMIKDIKSKKSIFLYAID